MGGDNLTREEIELIRTSWEPVTQNMDSVSQLLFKVMFTKYPDWEQLFSKFKVEGKPLVESEAFLDHAKKNVMGSMAKIIAFLDKEKEKNDFLVSVGGRHFKRKLNSVHFMNIVGIVMETLEKGLGEAFTEEMSKTWYKMLSANMKIMGEACDKGQC